MPRVVMLRSAVPLGRGSGGRDEAMEDDDNDEGGKGDWWRKD